MPRLRIEGLERDLGAEAGQDVLQACRKGHVNLFWSMWARLFNCRGLGLCGACPVRVLESSGKLPPRNKNEQRRLKKHGDDWRLACQLPAKGDLRIEPFPMVPPEERYGAEAVRRAQMDQSEREELLAKEREARLEARRAQVARVLETRKQRRSKLAGAVAKRFKKKEKGEQDEAAPGDGKKKRGGLADRLRKAKSKERKEAEADKSRQPKPKRVGKEKGDKPKRRGLGLPKKGKKNDKQTEKPPTKSG